MTRRSPKQSKIDEHAFPVRIRVLVTEHGIIALGRNNDIWDWLRLELGWMNAATTPHSA